jgi:hypothetical protein
MKTSHPKALEDQATQIIDYQTILPNSNQLRIAIEQPWQPLHQPPNALYLTTLNNGVLG